MVSSVVVVAVGAVHMAWGDHRDGHGATTGRGCNGRSGSGSGSVGVAVIVAVPMVVGMRMGVFV